MDAGDFSPSLIVLTATYFADCYNSGRNNEVMKYNLFYIEDYYLITFLSNTLIIKKNNVIIEVK